MAMTYREIVPKGRQGQSECVEAGRPVVLETEQIKPGRGQRNRNKRSKGRRLGGVRRSREANAGSESALQNSALYVRIRVNRSPGASRSEAAGPRCSEATWRVTTAVSSLQHGLPPLPRPSARDTGQRECVSAMKWNVNRGRTHGSATEVAGGRAIITFHVSVLN